MKSQRNRVMPAIITIAVVLTPTCGGQVDVSACEAPIATFTAPRAFGPPFEVTAGTGETFGDSSSFVLDVLLSSLPNACPTSWLIGYEVPLDRDLYLVRILVPTGVDGPFVGDFPIDSQVVGGPSVVSGFIPKGTKLWLTTWNDVVVAIAGSITITKFTAGEEIAGSFVANFADGTSIGSTFDVPFCSKCTGQ